MNFANKLKELRKQKGYSQEKLADEIGVSRQAITKWESGLGLPDIENIKIIASIFKMSIDNLLVEEYIPLKNDECLYQSETILDIDCSKAFDIQLGAFNKVDVLTSNDEKLHFIYKSNTVSSLDHIYKSKVCDIKSRIDIEIKRAKIINDKKSKEEVDVVILLPKEFVLGLEINTNANIVNIGKLGIDSFDLDGKYNTVNADVKGHIKLNTSSDVVFNILSLEGDAKMYLLKSIGTINISKDIDFNLKKKKRANVQVIDSGEIVDIVDKDTQNTISFEGIKSSLVINLD